MIRQTKTLTTLLFYVDKVGDITDILSGTPNMASARIQLIPAIRAAQAIGFEAKIYSLHSTTPSDIIKLAASSICLIGKMSANSEVLAQSMAVANLAAIAKLKRMGSKIIIQYSDHLMADSNVISGFYKDIFALADYIVYPSKALFNLSKAYISPQSKAAIIHDPWQLKSYHPIKELTKGESCRIIWFGSNKNIGYLVDSIPSLVEKSPKDRTFEISILGLPEAHQIVKSFLKKSTIASSNWTFRLVRWDNNNQPHQLESEISRAHIAVIPSNPRDELKAGVSHNRLVDAVRGGCITIASPMESYKELSNIALLGDNMGDQLLNALEDYQNHSKNILKHREKSLEVFSPDHNRRNWDVFFNTIAN